MTNGTGAGDPRIPQLARLAVEVGANVQPGQVVSVSARPGQEDLARAIAVAAYERGARFVDLAWFDPHVKLARLPARRRGHARVRAALVRPARHSASARLPAATIALGGSHDARPLRRR